MNAKNLKCPSCGMSAEWLWRGTGAAVRFVTVKCPADHHSIRKSYHVGSEKLARDELIKQWGGLADGSAT